MKQLSKCLVAMKVSATFICFVVTVGASRADINSGTDLALCADRIDALLTAKQDLKTVDPFEVAFAIEDSVSSVAIVDLGAVISGATVAKEGINLAKRERSGIGVPWLTGKNTVAPGYYDAIIANLRVNTPRGYSGGVASSAMILATGVHSQTSAYEGGNAWSHPRFDEFIS